jgi:hypothetical protein
MLKLLLATLAWSAGDEAVDLADLGMDDFAPYAVERNSLWILVPAFALAIVLLHLKKIQKKEKK